MLGLAMQGWHRGRRAGRSPQAARLAPLVAPVLAVLGVQLRALELRTWLLAHRRSCNGQSSDALGCSSEGGARLPRTDRQKYRLRNSRRPFCGR